MTLPPASRIDNAYCVECREPVRAVLGHRRLDLAEVGVQPYVYACDLYDVRVTRKGERAAGRLHRHQGRAMWMPDGRIHLNAADYNMGWREERNRIRGGEAIEERRRLAREWSRRPAADYVRPPAPAPVARTVQRRLTG